MEVGLVGIPFQLEPPGQGLGVVVVVRIRDPGTLESVLEATQFYLIPQVGLGRML